MSTLSFNIDVDALAREEIYGSRAKHLLGEDLRSGMDAEEIDWSHFTPMWRLGLDNLLPENDREQLIRLAHSVSAGEDVEPLVKAIRESTETKPLVVALAGIFREVAARRRTGIPHPKDTDSLVMVGAMMGAYVGFLNEANLPDAANALLSISAAFGGAIAVSAILQIQEIQAQRSRST